jgi:signal transduction histidine kinase
MELSLSYYSVHDTVESVRSTLHPLAAEKGLELAVHIPEEIPFAYGDFGRITQCLMNLAGNSLKFTREGSVRIVVELNGALLVYRVADTGIGIPPDKIDSLFTEFKQTDATIASEFGGRRAWRSGAGALGTDERGMSGSTGRAGTPPTARQRTGAGPSVAARRPVAGSRSIVGSS